MRGGLHGPEDPEPRRPERVDHACGQWRLGADDGQRDLLQLCECHQIAQRGAGNIRQFRLPGRARVARGDEHLRHPRGLCELPRERVLAASAADDEDLHRFTSGERDRRFPQPRLMPEMADARKYHRDAALVGRRDHLVVAHTAARLDNGAGTVIRDDVEPVAKRKEGVRGHDGAVERELARCAP